MGFWKRKPKIRKKKELVPIKTLSEIEKIHDDVYSVWLRVSNADDDGIGTCYTCRKKMHWTKLQCGHYWSRKKKSVRFDVQNTKPQCAICNVGNEGEKPKFAERLIEEYGLEGFKRLSIKAGSPSHIKKFEHEIMIDILVKDLDKTGFRGSLPKSYLRWKELI